jgi:hypothetical protein
VRLRIRSASPTSKVIAARLSNVRHYLSLLTELIIRLPRGIYKDCAPMEHASPLEVSIRGLQERLLNTSETPWLAFITPA